MAALVTPRTDRSGPAAAADWPVFICLLGSFHVFIRDRPLLLRNADKTKALLVNLVLGPQAVPRETLLQSLWPDSPAELAGQALNSLVHSLRRHLAAGLAGEPPVICVDGHYRLNVEAGIGIDVICFDQCLAAGFQYERSGQLGAAIEQYERAIALYRGDLCVVGDTPALLLCEALRARYLNLLARLADFHFSQADYAHTIALAQRLLTVDPCREDAHRLIMRCYLRQGQRAQALRQFQLCAQVLRSEFDAAPEPATAALYEQIRLAPDQI
jgi:DNA-binding SARP family transcriptional activator